jgi:acetyltransferase-like isoleucine patch superfamily enzyme
VPAVALVGQMRTDAHSTRRPLQQALSAAADHVNGGRVAEAELLYRMVLDAEPGNVQAQAALAELTGAARSAPEAADRRPLHRRLARQFGRPAVEALAQRPRIWKYRVLSTCPGLVGTPVALQPVLFAGPGEVVLGEHVQFGWRTSPLFYTGYCYVEVSRRHARIEVGDRVEFNNNSMLKSEGAGISVGRDGLFGAHVEIFDSNFHDLHPERRRTGEQRMAPVVIGENVFVGMGVRILKGVTVGADSVIGAGAVVSSSIPAGVIVAGNPARVIREL